MDLEQNVQKNVSYLQARDPSILAGHLPVLNKKRLNFTEKISSGPVTKIEGEEIDNDNQLRVYLRIKGGIPFDINLYKIDGKILICKIPEDSYAARNARDGELVTKKYTFSKIFGPDSKQADLFNHIVKPKILEFINGHNSTLMTYGTTSAGKTFTVVGSPEEPGILPRALEYLFRTLPELKDRTSIKPTPNGKVQILDESLQKDELRRRIGIVSTWITQGERNEHIKTYKAMQSRLSGEPVGSINIDNLRDVTLAIWISFAEIYNEHVYDLLQPPPARGHQRPKLKLGSCNGQTYIKDLTNIYVTNGIDAFMLLQYGLHNLNYASTALNSHSSRSHCIFTIKLVQRHNYDKNACISSFHFCDLAGSERSKKTQNVGERLVESNNINASLLVLGRCISNIRTVQQHKDVNFVPPFRESKLTQLFQKALTGQENISMIVNISPTRHLFDETNHVLNFSAIAREIICEELPKVEPPRSQNRYSEYTERRLSVLRNQADLAAHNDNNEISRLTDIIDKLTAELEWVKLDAAEELNENREYLIKGYTEILEETEEKYQRKIKDLNAKHAEEIERIKAKYEMESSTDDSDIVVIDDDLEELKEQTKLMEKKIKDLKEQLEKSENNQKMLVAKMEAEININKKTLKESKELNKCLMLENLEVKASVNELKKENFLLREKLNEQNRMVEKYMVFYREKTELLEGLNENDTDADLVQDENKEDNMNVSNVNVSEPALRLSSSTKNSLQDLIQELRRS